MHPRQRKKFQAMVKSGDEIQALGVISFKARKQLQRLRAYQERLLRGMAEENKGVDIGVTPNATI